MLPSFATPEWGGRSRSECALRASQLGATVGGTFGLPDQRVARAHGTKLKAIIRHSGGSTASLRPRVGGFHPSAVVCEDHRYVLKKRQKGGLGITRDVVEEILQPHLAISFWQGFEDALPEAGDAPHPIALVRRLPLAAL